MIFKVKVNFNTEGALNDDSWFRFTQCSIARQLQLDQIRPMFYRESYI